jgi:hydroxymethylpyrimidine/phosphomethylpyrimidine kinase
LEKRDSLPNTKEKYSRKALLIVGGLDPSGGAGVLTDCRAARAARVHPAAVVSVRTVQDGNRFLAAVPGDSRLVESAVRVMLSRFPVGAVKVGALGSAANAALMAGLAAEDGFPKVVLDPVLRSSSGGSLVDGRAVDIVKQDLLSHTTLVTPNLDEAGILAGMSVTGLNDMRAAAKRLLDAGASAVLVKGGHLPSGDAADLLADRSGLERVFRAGRVEGGDVRGTGCALATLIACFIAKGAALPDAVERAKVALTGAIEAAYRIGEGPRMLGDFDIRVPTGVLLGAF